MNKNCRRAYLICAVLLMTIVAGCAQTRSEPSDAFLAPISDDTLDLVGEVHFGLQLADSVLLNHYFDSDTPRVDTYSVLFDDLVAALRAIVYYSVDLVDLAEAAEGNEVIEPLIELISTLDSELRALASAQPHMGGIDRESVFADMRAANNLTHALRAGDPLMADYAEVVKLILSDTDQALADAIVEVFEMIDATHAPMLTYGENLAVRQNGTLKQLGMMDQVWKGDDDAWTELVASDWALSSEIGRNAQLTPDNAERAEAYLIEQLNKVATIRDHLRPAYDFYQKELEELYLVEDQSEATLRLILLVIENWDKAQSQLAAGEKGAFSAFTATLMKAVYRAAASRIGR